jgi:hypothetical protein
MQVLFVELKVHMQGWRGPEGAYPMLEGSSAWAVAVPIVSCGSEVGVFELDVGSSGPQTRNRQEKQMWVDGRDIDKH